MAAHLGRGGKTFLGCHQRHDSRLRRRKRQRKVLLSGPLALQESEFRVLLTERGPLPCSQGSFLQSDPLLGHTSAQEGFPAQAIQNLKSL